MNEQTDPKLKRHPDLGDDFPVPDPAEWRKAVEFALKGAPWETLQTPTYEGITLDPIYQGSPPGEPTDFPGHPDFRRGSRVEGYLTRPWGIVQEFSLKESPGEVNRRIRSELARGLEVIKLPLGRHEKDISVEFLEKLLDGVDLKGRTLILSGGISPLEYLMLTAALLRRNGLETRQVNIIFDMDPLAAFVRRGHLELPVERLLDRLADGIRWAEKLGLGCRLVSVDGGSYRDAGASIVQQGVCLLATGVFYLDRLRQRGLDLSTVARHLHFNLSVGPFFFMELAALRALRMVWAKVIQAFGGGTEDQRIFINARTSRYFFTRRDPAVNILRSTTEAFCAVAGGVDTLQIHPFRQSPEGTTGEFPRRIARNIQLILRDECHLDRLIDPGGGSAFLETLTHELGGRILEKVQEIDGSGGILEQLNTGTIQKEIEELRNRRSDDVHRQRRIIVGTNRFVDITGTGKEKVSPPYADDGSSPGLVYNTLTFTGLPGEGYPDGRAPFPAFTRQVEQFLSGETFHPCDRSGKAPGEIPVHRLSTDRLSEPLENLADRLAKKKDNSSGNDTVAVLPIRGGKGLNARVEFAADFFLAAGLAVRVMEKIDSPREAADLIKTTGAATAVICSEDAEYEELVARLVPAVKAEIPGLRLVLAGDPGKGEAEFRRRGVDGFIYRGAHLLDTMKTLGLETGGRR